MTKDYAKLNEELMSKRLISESDVIHTNDSIPEKNKELIAKLQKELEIYNTDENDIVPDWYQGPDGKYIKRGPKTMVKVPTKGNDINKDIDKDTNVNQTIGNQFNSENVNKNFKIIDKDIEKDINEDIDKDTKDSDIDNREENFMADPDGYVKTVELLRRDMELGNKEIIKELGNLKEKEIQLEESVTGLDKKVCDGNDCHIDDQNRTNDLFRELRERIQFLERPRYVCPYCHTGILTQGESECNVCGGEVGKWKQKVEMVARG